MPSCTPGISDLQLQLGFGHPGVCTYTYTRLELLSSYASLLRVPGTSTSSPQLLKGNGFSVLKSVVFKSYAGTPATSQPSGLPLPFPVPSKVSWLHKRGGRHLSGLLLPPLHTLLAQAPTRLPRRTHARTHTARTYTRTAHKPGARLPTPAARPEQASPLRLYIKHSPQNRLPHVPASG